MTEPKMVKAMEYLDDDLIVAAAEEKKAAPRFNKKKALTLLAACLLLISTFVMMGMEQEVIINYNQKEDFLRLAEYHAERGEEDWAAYYTKWSEIEFSQPFPDEWRDGKNSWFKDFVTVEMANEMLHGSTWEAFLLDEPPAPDGTVVQYLWFYELDDGSIHLGTLRSTPGAPLSTEQIEETCQATESAAQEAANIFNEE